MAGNPSSDPATPKSGKKPKKHSSAKSEKKRAREDDAPNSERKSKKSKTAATEAKPESQPENDDGLESKKERKERKKKRKSEASSHQHDANVPEAVEDAQGGESSEKLKDDSPIELSSDADDQKESPTQQSQDEAAQQAATSARDEDELDKVSDPVVVEDGAHAEATVRQQQPVAKWPAFDAMDVDAETNYKGVYGPPDMPDDLRFPFFSQTVSLYLPLWPIGWEKPIMSAQEQHFKPLMNSYVPDLHGVLLKYDKVAVGAAPGRRGAATSDDEPTTVLSRNEYGVGFGWVTADVELFMPRRGSWMEGTINLQTEGHIGVVCFGKFNASIEAVRLPQTWRWVPEDHEFEHVTAAPDEYGVVPQLDTTGFWVDGKGARVQGKICFRIRNFDAGTSGESSYLSLEGTMLDEEREKELSAEEARNTSLNLNTTGGHRKLPDRRPVPESSLTCLATEQQPQVPATGDQTEATEAAASGGKDAVKDGFEGEDENLAAASELQSEMGEDGGFESDD
ncbi:hypothetical protein CDD80_4540 [Ophiocordyceps camponoti-rufipedis]|uniref:DNA-directed RNA polymerase subunit n=1 Tax=Ophiocordyceps camponoti-rufipedis TaxID=2004952 RepID=A0A2C5YUI0_9HYPO|nr:hypothetical protein CDD80_4540 [Ophiocordyceps camponoti-rufipedis]